MTLVPDTTGLPAITLGFDSIMNRILGKVHLNWKASRVHPHTRIVPESDRCFTKRHVLAAGWSCPCAGKASRGIAIAIRPRWLFQATRKFPEVLHNPFGEGVA